MTTIHSQATLEQRLARIVVDPRWRWRIGMLVQAEGQEPATVVGFASGARAVLSSGVTVSLGDLRLVTHGFQNAGFLLALLHGDYGEDGQWIGRYAEGSYWMEHGDWVAQVAWAGPGAGCTLEDALVNLIYQQWYVEEVTL